MYFYHSDSVWETFPELNALTITVRDVVASQPSGVDFDDILNDVSEKLDAESEGQMKPIQAWRQAYARMGLKPTQYRCASEALLRRYRKEKRLPRVHPLVDTLNAESMRAAIPIAAYDVAHVAKGLCVQPATGKETYQTFQGDIEAPIKGEIVFNDALERAHARRWVYRQAATSAVSAGSDVVLIVAETMHDGGAADLMALRERIVARAFDLGLGIDEPMFLTAANRRFEFEGVAA